MDAKAYLELHWSCMSKGLLPHYMAHIWSYPIHIFPKGHFCTMQVKYAIFFVPIMQYFCQLLTSLYVFDILSYCWHTNKTNTEQCSRIQHLRKTAVNELWKYLLQMNVYIVIQNIFNLQSTVYICATPEKNKIFQKNKSVSYI